MIKVLIASRNESIRIIDAATGTYLHEIQTNHRFVTETTYQRDTRIRKVKMNSIT